MPSIKKCQEAGNVLRSTLRELDMDPETNRLEEKVTWMCSLTSEERNKMVTTGLPEGQYFGVLTTEILGMVRVFECTVFTHLSLGI
jgi:hypothetical protein